jgi:hypothetical protein
MFAYDDAVTERYPTIRAGVIHATGLANGPSPPALLDEYRAEQRAASESLKATAIADLPSIAAWRRAFTGFGAKPTQFRNAAEALLRRLAKHGDIPTINTLVDIGNLVSIPTPCPSPSSTRPTSPAAPPPFVSPPAQSSSPTSVQPTSSTLETSPRCLRPIARPTLSANPQAHQVSRKHVDLAAHPFLWHPSVPAARPSRAVREGVRGWAQRGAEGASGRPTTGSS